MSDLAIRLATQSDIDELVEMRADFTFGTSGRWHIWVAEVEGQLVSHLFVALIEKVPRPVRDNSRIAYLTNVYTRVAYRNQGIGARLIKRAQEAASAADVELIIVWPSEESVEFYTRHGFAIADEPMIWEA